MNELSAKLEFLKDMLAKVGSGLVAYSGGGDSTFLLKVAKDVLKDKVIAVTATSEIYPSRELEEAKKNTKMLGVKHLIISTKELDDPDFVSNTPERCYYCKKKLFSKLFELAKHYGLNYVFDGSNYDDVSDFRPGMRAASELGVKSPLKDVKLTKEEIRNLSKKMNLPTWDKPSSPCLATRFPYGSKIIREKLLRVDQAEEFLAKFGIGQLRVRDHGNIARIEVLKEDMHIFLNEDISKKIVDRFRALGYTYICLDLLGYRRGSMSEVWIRRK
ncbi:MAG: ATP-dependent sacrificial sulfur transferase LarE [candidate division Zixibacteria bacterium]|nr:ATP-dependent sacrificial sulfur transferase LarE [candidate division Zixibacteria bacterium]